MREGLLNFQPTLTKIPGLHSVEAVGLQILLVLRVGPVEVAVQDILHIQNEPPGIEAVVRGAGGGAARHLIEERVSFDHQLSERADELVHPHPVLFFAAHDLILRIAANDLVQHQKRSVSGENHLLRRAVLEDVFQMPFEKSHRHAGSRGGDDVLTGGSQD